MSRYDVFWFLCVYLNHMIGLCSLYSMCVIYVGVNLVVLFCSSIVPCVSVDMLLFRSSPCFCI